MFALLPNANDEKKHEMEVTIIGLGAIGIEYSQIFRSLGFIVNAIGRSAEGCRKFEAATGIPAVMGRDVSLSDISDKSLAVVAVGGAQLGIVTKELINAGFARILAEKPGAIGYSEVDEVSRLAGEKGADVRVAYNRRFYDSVAKGLQIIAEDDGPRALHFDFTEWLHRIEPIEKEYGVKEQWFFHNSTHVVDMAFFLAGWPTEMTSLATDPIRWHPYTRFVGSGKTNRGAVFSFNSDWQGPGRWQIEITTRKNRLIYRPLEELQLQPLGSIAINPVELEITKANKFKPGFYNQVLAFLEKNDDLPTIAEQAEHLKIYRQICPYSE